MWYVVLAFDPDADLGVALATNGSTGGQPAIDAGLAELLREWAGAGGSVVERTGAD
jgi:hypothetical protein